MKITKSEIKDMTGVITMVVEPADYQEEVQKELRQIRQKANVPGFRPGMVPAGLVKKMYGKGILADVINKTIGAKLGEYIEAEKLNVLGDPLPNEELTPSMDLDNQDTFTFAFDIAVAPEFNAKLDGKNKLTHYTITVTDEMVDNQVKSYAARFGEYVDAQEVQEGDVLRGLLKEVGNDTNPLQKENAMMHPQYMKDEKVAKSFYGKKLGDVVTFNPMKAFDSAVEVASLLGIKKEEAENLTADFTFEIQGITRHKDAAIDGELFAKIYGPSAPGAAKGMCVYRVSVKSNISSSSVWARPLDAAVIPDAPHLQFHVAVVGIVADEFVRQAGQFSFFIDGPVVVNRT